MKLTEPLHDESKEPIPHIEKLRVAADSVRNIPIEKFIRPETVILSFGFSVIVGIGFGLYPALKASRFDPIEALRFE